jgi:hypothetical protein
MAHQKAFTKVIDDWKPSHKWQKERGVYAASTFDFANNVRKLLSLRMLKRAEARAPVFMRWPLKENTG